MTEPRTDEQILAGAVPPHTTLVLGGTHYPVREPSNARARRVRAALEGYEANAKRAIATGGSQSAVLESMIDECLQAFSPDVEADWPRIAETATDSERIAAIVIIRDAVIVPFQTLVKAAAPAPANRAARRKAKK